MTWSDEIWSTVREKLDPAILDREDPSRPLQYTFKLRNLPQPAWFFSSEINIFWSCKGKTSMYRIWIIGWLIYVWVLRLCRLNLSVSVSLPVSSLLESIGLFIWRKDGGPLIDNLSQLYTLLDPKLFLFNSLTSSDSIILRNLSKFSKFRIEEKYWFSRTMGGVGHEGTFI